MSAKPPRKAGRPTTRPENKSVKPNVTLRPHLIRQAEEAAARAGMTTSEWFAMALAMQVARDEQAAHPSIACVPDAQKNGTNHP